MKAKINLSQFGKREIMIVAHSIVKRDGDSFIDALKYAWKWFKANDSLFVNYLGSSIKNKRKVVWNKLLSGNPLDLVTNGEGVEYNLSSYGWFMNNKYNVLFN